METKVIKQILSTEKPNDKGYVVLNDGIWWGRYEKNPILLYNHDWDYVLGNVSNIRREGEGWVGELRFDMTTPLGREKWEQYSSGVLRGVSIMGKPYYTVRDGLKVCTRFDVYEISLVVIPSNEDCVSTVEGVEPALSPAVEFSFKDDEEVVSFSSKDEDSITKYFETMKEENKDKKSEFDEGKTEAFSAAKPTEESRADSTSSGSEDEKKPEGFATVETRGIGRKFRDFMRSIGVKLADEDYDDDDDDDDDDRRRDEDDRNLDPRPDTRRTSEREEDRRAAREAERFSATPMPQEVELKTPQYSDAAAELKNQTKQSFSTKMKTKTLHEYFRDSDGKAKFCELAAFSSNIGKDFDLQSEKGNILREYIHTVKNDRAFAAFAADMHFDVNGRHTGTLQEAIGRMESFASGINSINFVENTPDLAQIEWSTIIYRLLLPDDSWADRIPRLSVDNAAGVVWINSAISPKIFFGNRAPLGVQGETYDDDPVGMAMKLFAVKPIVWQQSNTDLLVYDDVALGTSEALRVLRSRVHTYWLQKLSEKASVKIGTSGTATYNAANQFPANPAATGTLKAVVPQDITRLQTGFINQNFVLDTFAAELVMPAIMMEQLQTDPTLATLLTKNAGSLRPNFGEYSGFVFRPRSITGLYDTASQAVIDPELYMDGKINNDGTIGTYVPPVIPATAYGTALAFIPSEAIIGVGRTNVHMVTSPENYGWEMSMDFRTGAAAGRKNGEGIGLIYPSK